MAATASIQVLLKFFATKQNSPFVIYKDFSDYIKRYAQHNVEEQADLIPYLGNPDPAIEKELITMCESGQAAIIDTNPAKKMIFCTGFLTNKYTERYKEIQGNASIPFPNINDLPKQTPMEVIQKQTVEDIISKLLISQDKEDKTLYALSTPNNSIPAILFPANIPVNVLASLALDKIIRMLKKDEYHDYYLKKLRISNPGKEMTAQNFFKGFISSPQMALKNLESSGDSFYFWNQLFYFIKQDCEKVKDFTQEDINVLQSVSISEIVITHYKNKAQQNLQRETALKTLQLCLTKPPFYFTMDTILKFTDTKGVPLYGQFSDKDLKGFLQKETTESASNELPRLLVFKTENDARYFIYKNNVIPLILRLASDAHNPISEELTKDWHAKLLNFEKSPDMTDEAMFNQTLEVYLKEHSPVLYTLLNANFLLILNQEMQEDSEIGAQGSIFEGSERLPYSVILNISKTDILSSAKILLPIWYTIPVISWLIALFTKKPSKKKAKNQSKTKKVLDPESVNDEIDAATQKNKSGSKPVSKKDALIKAAKEVERDFVPNGSTLESELTSYKKVWNKMISKQANSDLTEDVNALIRDYMRKVLRTITSQSFTAERISDLAQTLVDTPNMKKISEHDALYNYVRLYMVYIVKNM
ncbi:MAG: hypothetical protein MJ169_05300 [Treponema sp.]|nr:hypothetical protein [Treponema sp.]